MDKHAGSTRRELPPDDFSARKKERLRRRLLRNLEQGLHFTGLDRGYRGSSGARGVAILVYHAAPSAAHARFIDPRNRIERSLFVRQMEFLARHRRVLVFEELLDVLQGRLEPPPGAVALTFDDGYRDHGTFVAPLLESLGLSATFYLPTSLLARGEIPWPDRLYTAFRYRTRDRLEVPEISPEAFSLSRRDERYDAYRAMTARLIESGLEARRVLLERVIDALAPSERPPRLLMTISEARSLTQRFPRMRLGLHGSEHLDMTAQPDPVVRSEFVRCIEECRSLFDQPGLDFAYPYSRADARTRAIAEGCGLRSAMVGENEIAFPRRVDPLAIPRIETPTDVGRLSYVTSGSYPELSRALRRIQERLRRTTPVLNG